VDDLGVDDYKSFGQWAAAHVTTPGERADAAFEWSGGQWVLKEFGTGLVPEDYRADGVPEEVITFLTGG
jgi:hypothetical protein